MIRPCDECGGSGKLDLSGDGMVTGDCLRCEGMPKLKCQRSYHNEPGWMPSSEDVCQGWFFPDPDTVMKWCEQHGSDAEFPQLDKCSLRHASDFDAPGYLGDCELVWVARPTPLVAVEE